MINCNKYVHRLTNNIFARNLNLNVLPMKIDRTWRENKRLIHPFNKIMKKPETRRRILEPQQTSFPDIFYTDTGRWFQPMLDRRVLFGLQRESSRGAHEIYMKRSRRSDRAHNERHGSPPHCPRSFAERTGCTGYAPLATMAKSPPKNRDP